MDVRTAMTRSVSTIDASSTLAEAAKHMRDLDVGVLPVMNDEEIFGIITDRDIVVRGIAEGKDARRAKVSDVCSKDPISCSPDDSIDDAARIMEERKVRRLLVVDEDDSLVGVLSIGDIATHLASHELPGEVLEKVSSD